MKKNLLLKFCTILTELLKLYSLLIIYFFLLSLQLNEIVMDTMNEESDTMNEESEDGMEDD